ncbi:MAG TPA: glycosyltransferase [Terriglobales bacterium]|nr:glycosyltransferase [Terriglobales bacterium]
MHILLVHNTYIYPGGEDDVFAGEKALLEKHGHTTSTFVRDNREIETYSPLQRAVLGLRATWSPAAGRSIAQLLRDNRADVAHFHNTFPLISPSAYYACRDAGVRVVQSLHNPRLLCPGNTMFREGKLCLDCFGKSAPWPSVVHGCYHKSRAQSAAISLMIAAHHAIGTWNDAIDAYIVSTAFYRGQFIAAGLPEEKIHVKPHFVFEDPGVGTGTGTYALFAGRLAEEKGIATLASAWKQLRNIPLKVRGEGPLSDEMERAAAENSCIEMLPRLGRADYYNLVRGARFLVWPSIGYYETFGRVVIEAFACGVPVIASDLGACAELVTDGETGLHVKAGDAADLAKKVQWAWEHPREMQAMGKQARERYQQRYTPEQNYRELIAIYEHTQRG